MTDEMIKIINAKEQHIVVQAKAGSGKSSTMLEYVKTHPTEKILFLVYNKSMATDFSNRLKGINHNCEVRTIHSLAYRWFMKANKKKKSLRNLSVLDIQSILGETDYITLSSIKFSFDMFLSSNYSSVDELPKKYSEHNFEVKKLLKYLLNESNTISHNLYLKLFQLSKPKLNYDTILLDETNDINLCMLDIILSNLDKKIICVGDSRQMINSFNFNVDGLEILIEKYGFTEYHLTNSFRISEEVAQLSSRYMKYMYDKKFVFHGLGKTKIDKLDLNEATQENQISLLCRTRLGGLKRLISFLSEEQSNKKVYYQGGLKGFGIEEIKKILTYHGTVYMGGKKFYIGQLRTMKAQGLEDAEVNRILGIYDFCVKYPNAIELLESTEVKDMDEADIIVMTSHSSKGLTLDNVLLCNDFPPIEDVLQSKLECTPNTTMYDKNMIDAEANLVYVALTRATKTLDFGQVLTKKEKQNDREDIDLDF